MVGDINYNIPLQSTEMLNANFLKNFVVNVEDKVA